MEFNISLARVVAWPAVVVACVGLLRDPLSKAISRLVHVRYKDKTFEAEFEQTLKRATLEADQAALPPPQPEPEGSERAVSLRRNTNYLLQLAENFPEAAVLEAWRELELAMRETIRTADIDYGLGLSAMTLPVSTVVRELRKSHPEPQLFDIVEELRVLRNKVAHTVDAELSTVRAKEYVTLAKRVSDELWRVVGC